MADVSETTERRDMDCLRCHQQCGWCADYRWHHGKMRLPGSRKFCTLTEVVPEGDDCPICHGTRRVRATITTSYEAIANAFA